MQSIEQEMQLPKFMKKVFKAISVAQHAVPSLKQWKSANNTPQLVQVNFTLMHWMPSNASLEN
jgi:hypothetical protein